MAESPYVQGWKAADAEWDKHTAELRGIVDKLPKDAEGAPVPPGIEVWIHAGVRLYEPGGRRTLLVVAARVAEVRASGFLAMENGDVVRATDVSRTRKAADQAGEET